MYFAAGLAARASLVHPPPPPPLPAVTLGRDCICLGVVSEDVVGSEVGVVDTVGGVSETGSVVSVATPLTSVE
jgi:hypothetical protein